MGKFPAQFTLQETYGSQQNAQEHDFSEKEVGITIGKAGDREQQDDKRGDSKQECKARHYFPAGWSRPPDQHTENIGDTGNRILDSAERTTIRRCQEK